ncbi:uncharacterized protein QC763_205977 [Podospora pseudopauciseta]|uniref:BZIP domain-containing protein n=1 Tax=Podospora pseudopauciseta TaxID=2093780 RepID=A0ABR0HNW6_9PEZI|nr:hypothetical protein QC763_205977 [Podospora pseudopauciseta]
MIGLEFPKNTSSLLSICSFFHRVPCLSYLTPVPRWKHQISHSAHRRLPGVRVNLSIVFLVSCCWAVSCLRNTSSLSLTGYLISCLSAPGTAHIGMRLGSPRAGPSDYSGIDPDYTGSYPDESLVDWDGAQASTVYTPAPSSSSKKSRSSKRSKSSKLTSYSGSDTETEEAKMSSRSSKYSGSTSSKKEKSSSPRSKESDDWSAVTDPEMRRRIQNRIAQRKFRDKAREQKERDQRDALNEQYADSSYRIRSADELVDEGDLAWGSFSMGYMLSRGHEAASAGQRTHSGGSRRESDLVMDQAMYSSHSMSPYPPTSMGIPTTSGYTMGGGASWGGDGASSGGGDVGYYDSPYGR